MQFNNLYRSKGFSVRFGANNTVVGNGELSVEKKYTQQSEIPKKHSFLCIQGPKQNNSLA